MCRKSAAVLFLVVVLQASCTTVIPPNQSNLELKTEPTGAMVYQTQDGSAWGMAPQLRIFTLSPSALQSGVVSIQITAIWPSGAQKTETVKWSTNFRTAHYTVSRPVNVPGLNIDLAHALQIQARDAAEKASADAAYAQAMAQFGAGMADAVKTRYPAQPYQQPSPKPAESILCTTIGNITTCRPR
jgi:hypothetical protein